MPCKGDCEIEVLRILLGQASCPGALVWVPCGASRCPEIEVPILGGGEDVGGRRPLTSSTHLTDPRWVRRGAGPALRAGGGGRSHVRALGALCLSQARSSLVSSAPRLRACSVRTHPESRVFLGGRGRRPAEAAMTRGGQPIAATYLRAGSRGAMARRVGSGLGGRLLLEAAGERGGLLPSPRAGRAMSSWTAPRNMSICTTACRSSRGGWG